MKKEKNKKENELKKEKNKNKEKKLQAKNNITREKEKGIKNYIFSVTQTFFQKQIQALK